MPKTFRMRVDAGLYFDVDADNERSAMEKAREVCEQLEQGMDALPSLRGLNAYANHKAEPTIEDEYEFTQTSIVDA